jgi:hypothetical protein
MVDENRWPNPDAQPHEDGEAKAFAKKFNISLDLAKRLTGTTSRRLGAGAPQTEVTIALIKSAKLQSSPRSLTLVVAIPPRMVKGRRPSPPRRNSTWTPAL